VLAAQEHAWLSAWRAVQYLQEVLTSLGLVWSSLVEPYSDEQGLRIWQDIGSEVSVLEEKLG
jgi:hypothetical protein